MEPVVLDCPVCDEATLHEVLKATQHTLTVACTECGEVRSASPPRTRLVELRLIISHEGQAEAHRLELDADEPIEVGAEFEHEGKRLLVTGLEMPEGKAKKARAEEIKVLHAKVFDTVPLKVAVNDGDVTKSHRTDVRPEAFFQIGEVILIDGLKLVIKTIKSDENRTLHRGGLPARHIVRVFCDAAPPGAKVGAIVESRPRGKKAAKRAPAKARAAKPGPAKPDAPKKATGAAKPGGPQTGARSPKRGTKSAGASPRRRTGRR